MKATFLHLSDLHINKNDYNDIDIVLTALFEDLERQGTSIDYVLFNGDLIKHGNDVEEYDLALNHFIIPLLEKIGLTRENFFLVPGNHEVNRENINKFVDGDISNKFNSKEVINEFIDGVDETNPLLNRMKNYMEFFNSFNTHKYLTNKNALYNTHTIEQDGKKIGIACLNSAWSSYGGEEDMNKILIGERQVDNSVRDIKDCDFKICMVHHPVEWLKSFDMDVVYDRLIMNFDMVLTGHTHNQNYKDVSYDKYETIFVKSPALYQNRTYNGYSTFEVDLETGDIKFNFREYFENGGRRVFGKAERVAEDGEVNYSLKKKDNEQKLLKDNIALVRELKNKVKGDINKALLSVSSDSFAPKEMNDIFVSPLLTTLSENTAKVNDEFLNKEDIKLEEIINSNENIMFIGKKEIGKSTLLNFICLTLLNMVEDVVIPVVINFNDLQKGKNVFNKAINSYLLNYMDDVINLEKNLVEGNFVILIDDLNINEKKNIQKLQEFSRKYPNNRFIVSMNENIMQTLSIENLPELGFDYEEYYINSFRRGQIRSLIQNWYVTKEFDEDFLLNKIMLTFNSIGLPRTPMAVSLMLWALEKEKNFIPVNEATLIENFIQTLLEKLNPEDSKYENTGYSTKQDFLTYLAVQMLDEQKYYFENNEFEELFTSYFVSKGLDVDHDLKETFFYKGILLRSENKVYFRFRSFFEYFLSLAMEDIRIYEFITSEENYLNFKNEITFYAGLDQKNKSYDLLKIVEGRLIESFEDIDREIDIDEIVNMPIKELFSDSIEKDEVKERLQESKLNSEEKDAILDPSSDKEDSHLIDKNADDFQEVFIKNLELYSNILKNCELLDINPKEQALALSIDKYCKLTGALYQVLYHQVFEDKSTEKEFGIKWTENIKHMLTIGIPLVVQNQILKNLGSPKLKKVIKNVLDNSQNEFERYMLISLYGDLRIKGYLDLFEGLLKNTESSLIKELVISKLSFYNAFYEKGRAEEEKLLNILSEYFSRKATGNIRGKSEVKTLLRKRSAQNSKSQTLLN
ncbi:metallophosphoesterase [Pontibacillus salipaludis]|uniref:metallophosphoesterase n=1 Tax=Pontibacillus salipaludis TaxID=1697394 RepID=UPI0031E9F27A